ncbi:MAG: flavin reductase [Rectinemataceae bacterium]|nr:flavin reductase [Spirochaetaceae bacterium]
MLQRREVPLQQFAFDPAQLRDNWMVLCAGDFARNDYNAMTISWGMYGQIWNRMLFQVLVRPTRYTFEYMERYDTFTLNMFPPVYRPALSILGSVSGRHEDKIARVHLTPQASLAVTAPCFEEASLVLECRKIYWQDLDPQHFLDPAIEHEYPRKDYHRLYLGEILKVSMA